MEANTSTTNVNNKLQLFRKLTAVQNDINCGKNSYNKFADFKYRSAEAIMAAIKPVLLKHNCACYLTDDLATFDSRDSESGIPNLLTYVKATAIFIDAETGESLTSSSLAKECEHGKMTQDQWTVTASAYARKTALSGLFMIGDDEETNGQDNRKPNNQYSNGNGNRIDNKAPAAQQPKTAPAPQKQQAAVQQQQNPAQSQQRQQYSAPRYEDIPLPDAPPPRYSKGTK